MSDHEAIKANIQRALEQTKCEYLALLDEIPEELWEEPVGPPEWKFAELMAHIELRQSFVLPKTVNASLRGKQNAIPSPPEFITRRLSYYMSKFFSRRTSKETLRKKYERSDELLRSMLDMIGPSDWTKATRYPAGHHTIEEQFLQHRYHFLQHAEQIRAGLMRHTKR